MTFEETFHSGYKQIVLFFYFRTVQGFGTSFQIPVALPIPPGRKNIATIVTTETYTLTIRLFFTTTTATTTLYPYDTASVFLYVSNLGV